MCVCVCVCVAKPVAVEVRCHVIALILSSCGSQGNKSVNKNREIKAILLAIFSSPVQSTGRAIVVTLASALPLPLPFPSRHF